MTIKNKVIGLLLALILVPAIGFAQEKNGTISAPKTRQPNRFAAIMAVFPKPEPTSSSDESFRGASLPMAANGWWYPYTHFARMYLKGSTKVTSSLAAIGSDR